MDERRKRLLGCADDADVRGEHCYPDEAAADRSDEERALTRQPGQYVAGAEGTQRVITPIEKRDAPQ
jgi:hypothetical protein